MDRLITFTMRLGLIAPLSLILLGGCKGKSENETSVSGTITYGGKDQPVPGGTVRFFKKGGGGVYEGTLSSTGTYTIENILPGQYTVTVDTEIINPNKSAPDYDPKGKKSQMKGKGKTGAPGKGELQMGEAKYRKIPLKYGDPSKPLLATTLEQGSNTGKDFDLKD
jgi:hypothetical protein